MSDSEGESQIYGPVFPSNFAKPAEQNKNDENEDDDNVYGPVLPPSFGAQQKNEPEQQKIIGPCLPKNFLKSKSDQNDGPDSENEEDDDIIVGPLPPGQLDPKHLHDRPRSVTKDDGRQKREKWMLEPGKACKTLLPTKSVTKFSQKSSKTEKPLTEDERMEIKAKEEKEKRMDEFLKKYEKNNKRNVSLLETHRQEMKKNKKSKNEPSERREFDRERDLCAPRMDAKLKQTLIKEASTTFGTRFSSGRFEKFL